MRNILWVVFAVVFGASSTANAATLYAGANLGASKAASWCEEVVGDCEDVGTGWKIYLGGQVHPNWGIEAAYVDLGEFTATDTALLPFPIDASIGVSGINLAAVGTLPIAGPFALIAKLGVFLTNLDIEASGGGFSVSDSENSTDLTLGLGAKFGITDRVFARFEWERFADVGDDETGEDDVDFFSVGVGATF